MADEDCPPPLEDMTDVINRITALRTKVKDNKPSETKTIANSTDNNNAPATATTTKQKQTGSGPGACGFGGMKKGFLSGNSDNKKASNKPAGAPPPELPHIKSNPAKQSEHLVMQEVQRMREQLQKTDAWLTEDLLNKLGSNEKLMTMMADPRCERALQEFQANPDKALITYQHDKYIQEFFREFCDVLGNHYENLNDAALDVAADVHSTDEGSLAPPTTERKEELLKEVKSTRKQTIKQSAPAKADPEEDAKVQQVLQDPKLVQILQSENIMELIRSLKEDPEKAQRLLQQGGKEFQEKVRILVDAGLLAFQR